MRPLTVYDLARIVGVQIESDLAALAVRELGPASVAEDLWSASAMASESTLGTPAVLRARVLLAVA